MKTYSAKIMKQKCINIPCNICGSENYTLFLKLENCKFVKCLSCGLVYQNPQPVFDDLRLRYNSSYFKYELKNEENFFNLMKLGLKDINFDNISLETFENNNFLDIGCATGMLLEYMKGKGWIVQGVDICRESAEFGMKERNIDISIGILEEANFPDSFFSVIHFSHVIEHVPDPRSFLLEVYRILSPDGMAVITTPNVSGFQARLFGKNWRSAISDHLFLFSKTTLMHILLEVGYKVESIICWGGLAKGTAPMFIKKPMDFLAKKLGFGDVILFSVKKK